MRAALAEREGPLRYPIVVTFVVCCASAASGAITRPRASTTASPVRRMATSWNGWGECSRTPIDAPAPGPGLHRGAGQHALFDDLIRPPQHRLRDRQAERLGGFEVDDQLELSRLLDGEVGGLSALEDLVD